MLARDAVISSKPNSDPLPSSSFNKVFLKPPRPPSTFNNSWVGKFPAQFLPLVPSVLFSQSFIHAVLSPRSRPDGTVVSIVLDVLVLLLHLFNSMKHQAHFFLLSLLFGRLGVSFLFCPVGRKVGRLSGVLVGYAAQGNGFGEKGMKQSCYKIGKVCLGRLHVFKFEMLCVGLLAALSCII